jgi:replication factor C small subunit
MVDSGEMNNLLFAGPAGTGKTTLAYVIAKQLLGDSYKLNLYEFNASDDRGINFVREDIKKISSVLPINAKFKIIYLNEADNLTNDAQQALRRIIEKSSKNTRFIFDCNYPQKIKDPIMSRCTMFRFSKLPKESALLRMKYICNSESLKQFNLEILEAIYDITKGDMRKAIEQIDILSYKKDLTVADVYNSTEVEKDLKMFIKFLNQSNEQMASEMFFRMIDKGFNEIDILINLMNYIKENNIYTGMLYRSFLDELSEVDYRIGVGSTPDIQINGFIARMSKILIKVNKK